MATLDTPFTNDPPTLADIEVLRAKINELIAALRRQGSCGAAQCRNTPDEIRQTRV